MTKVVRVHRLGPPDVMQIEDMDVGAPGPGEVRINVAAIGLNRSEAMYRAGRYPIKPEVPTLMGYEASGTIDALGEGVEGFKPGDAVCVLPRYRLGQYGVYAEQAIVPALALEPVPAGLSMPEAASIWMQYFTALAIIEVGEATLGDGVIIRAASSSVGLAAIQLANWAGAISIAATRKSDKAEALKAQGAQHVVATDEVDLAEAVMKITGGKGARIAFDPVGGPDIDKIGAAMGERGIIFQYGGLSEQPTPFPHWHAAFKGLSVRGWVASEIWNHPLRYAKHKDLILRGLAGGHLKPVIAKTFPLDEIVQAHEYLESNQQVGKVVVTV